MFKYMLLDWDGCLADTLPVWYQGMKRGLSHFGVTASDREIKTGFQSWDFFVEMGVYDLMLFKDYVYGYFLEHADTVRFNDGVIDLLEHAKTRNVKTAIVTSSERESLLPVLSRLNEMEYFECIICREDVENLKPHPDPVFLAIEKMGGSREDAVMIGDSPCDIEAGKSAGVRTAWYTPENNHEYHPDLGDGSDMAPDMIISHMNELKCLI